MWKRLAEGWILVGCAHNCTIAKDSLTVASTAKAGIKVSWAFSSDWLGISGVKIDRVDTVAGMGCGKSIGESPLRTHSWPRL